MEILKSSEKLQKEIALKSTRITTKNQLISDLKDFKPNLENSNQVIYVLDSDNNKLDNKHGSNTIETIYSLIKDKEIKGKCYDY